MGKKKGKGGAIAAAGDDQGGSNSGMIWADPARIRFQHSRIRPVFSGCGRSVESTLEELRQGKLQPSDIPPIQVSW